MRQHTIPALTRRSLLGRMARRVLVGAASGSRQGDPVIVVAARTPTEDIPAARACRVVAGTQAAPAARSVFIASTAN